MSVVEEGFRHFWLHDIHRIQGLSRLGLGVWIESGDFVISTVGSSGDVTVRPITMQKMVGAFAYDSTKMASAAFETMFGIESVPKLPKSTSWIVIRAYYAAFFAAHALLRMFGTHCLQVDLPQKKSLDKVASAVGMLPRSGFELGFYVSTFDRASGEIRFRKPTARRGSHEIMWEEFASRIRSVSNHLLTVSSKFTQLSLQLSQLEASLRRDGMTTGAWLSYVRNLANYKHEFGLWFPYSGSECSASDLLQIARKWRKNPETFFPPPVDAQIKQHVWTSSLIVSICHAVSTDMAANTPRSFHSYGGLALVKRAG